MNVGGAVIPTLMSTYLVIRYQLWFKAALATAAIALVIHSMATPVPGIGIAVPVFAPVVARRVRPSVAREWAARAGAIWAKRLAQVPGVSVLNTAWFNEFTVVLPKDARDVVRALADRFILGGVSLGRLYPGEAALANGLLVTATETTTLEDIEALAEALEGVLA